MKLRFNRLGVVASALFLVAFAIPALAAEATKISDVQNSIFFRNGSGNRGTYGTNGGHASDRLFNGDFTDYTYCNRYGTTELVIDVTHIITDPDGQAFVTSVLVGHKGGSKYSLYYTTEAEPADILTYAADPRTWTAIEGATDIQEAGKKTYNVNQIATAVKYVFVTGSDWDAQLAEVEVQGYEYVPPKAVKISSLDRSIFFRNGTGNRGNYGTNGGHASNRLFNGDFTDYTYCNRYGTTELVIPTTGLDDQGNDTGVAWFVTDFLVGHKGGSKYSLYYTTEAEPADILTYAADPRTWIAIEGATDIQEAGKKTYGVNKTATAVKYVFVTGSDWDAELAEVEVWAMDPSTIACLHENMTDDYPAWTVCTPATCTENAIEERFCPDCNERFEREAPLTKLGHDFVATLTSPGTSSSYGSGYVECSRCDEFHLVFNGDHVDLTTLGGPPINGIVQYTDLYASSLGAENGGIKPVYMMDGFWDNGWSHAYYFENCSSNEYAQYSFGTRIELTQIEYSVINESQTVYFSKYDPDTGEETPLRTILIKKDTTEGADGYQRKTEYFQSNDASEKIFVDAVRMRIGDYVDPDTGDVTPYIGYNYGALDRHTIICEFHPWGTIEGAGKLLSVAQIGNVGYDSLADAIASITNDVATTIVLHKTTVEDVVIPADRNITIDLNGNSITNVASDAISVYGALTIADNAGGGKVVSVLPAKADLVNYPTGAVTIRGGTFEVPDDATYYNIKNIGAMTVQSGATVVSRVSTASTLVANGWYDDPGIDRGTTGSSNTAILTINGGTFDGGKNVVKNDDYGILAINGGMFGNISPNDAVIMNWHEATINNGTFTGAHKVIVNGSYGANSADKGLFVINGGTFAATNDVGNLFGYGLEGGRMADAMIVVSNGTFRGHVNGVGDNDGTYGHIAISGGTFDEIVRASYCAEGYAPVAEPDAQGNYTVVRVYEVAFVLPNDSVVTNVPAGDVPVWPLDSPPSKESTLEYDYFFVGWAPDEFETTPLAELPPATQATNFWALFGQSAIEYRITLNLNDGELVGIDPSDWSGNERVYTVEDSFELPMPVKNGCEFVGWIEGEVDSPVASVWISCSTGDRVFSAVWEETLPPEIDLSDPETAPTAAEIAAGAVPAGVQTDETTGEEEFVVCFHGKAGVTYQLQGSATLGLTEEQWKSPALAVGDAVRCMVDGGLVRLEFPMGGDNVPDAMFFKIGASRTPAASGD